MSERSRLRLFVLKVLIGALLATLVGRVWYLQVLAGDEYAAVAADNNRRELVEPAARGRILDIAGRPLVQNRTALVVSVDRIKLLRQKDDGLDVLTRLARIVKIPLADLQQRIRLCTKEVGPPCWNGSPYQPIPVTDRADDVMAQQIMERREDFPGVTAEQRAVRTYPAPLAANAAHVLGYLSPITEDELEKQDRDPSLKGTDLVGRAGLEQVYDGYLRGRPGITQVAVDSRGAVTGVLRRNDPEAGSSLVTNIDAGVQHVAEQALVDAVKKARRTIDERGNGKPFKADSAAAIVVEATTGRVVAMASYPTYAPAVWVGGISARNYRALTAESAGVPLLGRPIQGLFAPGSTFKHISTSAAVERAGYPLRGSYNCPGAYRVGNRLFKNFDSAALGRINLHTALVKSCDTVFYRFAYEEWLRDERRTNPREVMVAMAKAWGLGKRTGIDLPSESIGRIASRKSKQVVWDQLKAEYCKGAQNPRFDAERRRADREFCIDGWRYRAGDAANFSIGQGDTVITPLQLAVSYAALVNGGTLYRPQLARAVISPAGKVVKDFKPVVNGKLSVSPGLLEFMRSALAEVPTAGTARGAFAGFEFDKLTVGGKTGTAQVANKQDTAWFVGFTPADKPRYVAVVMVTQAGTGGSMAAPAVRQIFEGMYGLGGRSAVLPGGTLPARLPTIAADGTVVPPPGVIRPRPRGTPTPTTQALATAPSWRGRELQ